MTASAQDVQAKLDSAWSTLLKTTTSGAGFVKQHGVDWTKWPQGSYWYQAAKSIHDARTEAGSLVAPAPPVAAFTIKP